MERPDEGACATGARVVVERLAQGDADAEEHDSGCGEQEPARDPRPSVATRLLKRHGS